MVKHLLTTSLTSVLIIVTVYTNIVLGQGFNSIKQLEGVQASKNTADKPQSKVWSHAGKWWAVFPDETGTYVWRLDDTSWSKHLKISTSSATKADCKVVGDIVHILLYREIGSSYLASVSFDNSTGGYLPWTDRQEITTINLEPEAETATIEVDGSGRMWLASDAASQVMVRWSDAPYSTWSDPIVLASGIKKDDICAVVTLHDKIGVLWSDQNAKRFGFRVHNDGASPTEWGENEVPASQSAVDAGAGMADNHLNMAVSSDGTLYCAVKTGFDTHGMPKLALLVRRPSATWDNMYHVSDSGTRPIVVLNEINQTIKVVFTTSMYGGDIVYKEASTSDFNFCSTYPLLEGKFNYATSTKQSYKNETVILASKESFNSTKIVGAIALDSKTGSDKIRRPCSQVEEYTYAYPNPFTSFTTFRFPVKTTETYILTLYDAKGERIYEVTDTANPKEEYTEVSIDGRTLTTGFYFISLQIGDSVTSHKIFHNK